MEKRDVEIKTDSIKLDQFLKWVGLVETGGQAKTIVAEGKIKVNGQPENRRGKQLKKGDLIQFDEIIQFRVV
jgi:ribosome-associated protein